MSMLNRLKLFFKTRVSGYLTREGKWVDVHYDKRPTGRRRTPEPPPPSLLDWTEPEAPAAPPPAQAGEPLHLLSVLDTPPRKRAVPRRTARAVRERDEATAQAPEAPPLSDTSAPIRTEEPAASPAGLDYGRGWEAVEAALPSFGAEADWTPSKRKKANEAALEIIEHVKGVTTGEENRPLTTAEQIRRLHRLAKQGTIPKNWQAKLAAYSGQGGVGDSLNEYYTPPAVAAAMWSLLARLGLSQGHVLEPCAGTGVFQETKPAGIRMTAVEWDKASSTINAVLHPEDEVLTSALEDFVTVEPAKYDAVIGNVPFGVRGAILAHDKPDLKTAEEYFVDTALDKTKDGGVVCLVVPHGIATNPTSRSFRDRVLRKAEILGVHRLPNTAFAHSGTSVVTDILLLRKRPQDVAGALSVLEPKDLKALGVWDPAWLDGKILEDAARGHLHGTAQANWRGGLDVAGSMDGVPARVATAPVPPGGHSPTYATILAHLEDRPDLKRRAEGAAKKNPYPELPTGTTRLINGVLYILQGDPRRWHRADEIGPGVQYAPDSKEGRALALAESIKKLTERQARGDNLVSDATRQRTLELVQEYVQAFGNPAGDKVLAEMGQRDPRFLPLIAAVDAQGNPSPLLRGTVTGPSAAGLDTRDFDAVMQRLCSGDARGLTVEAIAGQWTGSAHEAHEERAKEVLAKLYASDRYAVSLDGQTWGLREDLLAGDLYPKLDALEAAVPRMRTDDPLRHKLERQIQWLKDELAPKTIEEFEVSLRSGWVPLPVLAEFLTAKARESYGAADRDIQIEVTFKEGVYDLKNVGKDHGWLSPIYEKYLNRLPLREEDWKKIPDLEREYHAWLAASQHRGDIEDRYNRLYNGFRTKRYGDEPVALEGWNPERTLNAYQNPALRWAAEEGRGIISYDVGLGKTPFAIALVKLLRQRGQAKRPVIVVPKSLTANWAAEIQAFAPGSKVLIIGETHTRDKAGKLKAVADSKEERDKKWHQLTQGDFDYCLVTYPAYNDIAMDPITRGEYVDQDFWTQRAKQLDQATPREIREIQERAQQAAADKDFRKRTRAIWWNDLGVDCLIVDEGHAFKNLFTARDRFGGKPMYLGGSGFSKRALDMQHKTRWIREQTGNKGVFFLTATPTKNSPLEVYSMLSHIAPEAFAERGLRNSEDFIDRYCDIQTEMVLGTDGEIGPAPVVKGFKNMGELRQIMGRYIYRKTAKDVGLVIPEKDVQEHYVEMTPAQKQVYAELRDKARNAEAQATGEAHIFSIMDKMGKAALDLALLDPATHATATSPKYQEAVKQITEGLKDGGQVVFIDSIEAHQRFKKLLVEAGVPEDQIGIINADVAPDSAKRQNVADDYVQGKLKVVIGNTATMGEGVNLQKFTSDIHHLDIPWEPASIQQRNGRGVRQGNKRQSVRIHTYLAKQSFDGYRFQTVSGKRDWQDQLWNGGDRIENLAAAQGTIGRDDFLIMMADDPDAARAELRKNKAAQLAKYEAVKKSEAVSSFTLLQTLKRNYVLLERKDTKTAQALAARIERVAGSLRADEHFPAKHLLTLHQPVVMNAAGQGFYAGATFQLADRAKAPVRIGSTDAKTWVVTDVDLDQQTVSLRPVGSFPAYEHEDPVETFKIDDLATGLTPAEPISLAEDLKASLKALTHVKHLSVYPPELVEAMEPEIQRALRDKLSHPEAEGESRPMSYWVMDANGRPRKLYSTGTAEASKADYLLPTPKYLRRLAELAYEAKQRAAQARASSPYRFTGFGRQKRAYYSGAEDTTAKEALNALVGWKEAEAWVESVAATKAKAKAEAEEPAPYGKAFGGRCVLTFGKSFPGHRGRPGLRGGSLPQRGANAGSDHKPPDWRPSRYSEEEEQIQAAYRSVVQRGLQRGSTRDEVERALRSELQHRRVSAEKIEEVVRILRKHWSAARRPPSAPPGS